MGKREPRGILNATMGKYIYGPRMEVMQRRTLRNKAGRVLEKARLMYALKRNRYRRATRTLGRLNTQALHRIALNADPLYKRWNETLADYGARIAKEEAAEERNSWQQKLNKRRGAKGSAFKLTGLGKTRKK